MILFLRAILALYQKFNILRLRKQIKCVPAFWKQNSYFGFTLSQEMTSANL